MLSNYELKGNGFDFKDFVDIFIFSKSNYWRGYSFYLKNEDYRKAAASSFLRFLSLIILWGLDLKLQLFLDN